MNESNHQIRLAQRPHGLPGPDVWEHATAAIEAPQSGQILVEVKYVSLDPAMRGWMSDARSYMPPVALGDVMRAGGAGRIVASADDRFAPGDLVTGMTGVQEYALLPAEMVWPADPAVAPLPRFLSALGSTGMTAYFGLLDIGRPLPGDTVVVSGAAGAVGSIAGQIAKLKGCRAIGIAGGPDKCRWLTDELGFDAAIDYRAAPGPFPPVCGSTRRTASTCSSTTSAGKSSTPHSRGWRGARGSSCAAGSRSTTRPNGCAARRTTCRW